MAARCYLALSANLGNRLANLQDALRRLGDALAIDAVSSLYESDPTSPLHEPPSYIAACAGRCDVEPGDLLALCQRIEWAMGRRPGPQPDSYPLAMDILAIEGAEFSTATFTPPRPRIDERPILLIPLADIAPDVMLPDGLSAQQAADRLVGESIHRVAGPEWRDAVAVAPPGQRIGVAAWL